MKIEEMILDRLQHLDGRVKGTKNGMERLSVHARGFAAGQVHRIIAERYFLLTLLDELEEVE